MLGGAEMGGLNEFSKRAVGAVIALWLIVGVYGMAVVWENPQYITGLFAYVGAPMGAGIAGYLAKAAFENRERIRCAYRAGQKPPGEDGKEGGG